MSLGETEAGLALLRFVWRPLRPVLDFGTPRQSVLRDTPTTSWWDVPVSIVDAGVLHQKHLAPAEVWAVRYLGDAQVGEGITLRWRTRDGEKYMMPLHLGETLPVPLALRDQSRGEIIIANDDPFRDKYKWRLTREGFFRWDELIHDRDEIRNIEWRIEVRRPAKKPWTSRHSYIISVPEGGATNDTFTVSMRRIDRMKDVAR